MLSFLLIYVVAPVLVCLCAVISLALWLSRPLPPQYQTKLYTPPRDQGLLGLLTGHMEQFWTEKRSVFEPVLEHARHAWANGDAGLEMRFLSNFVPRRIFLLDPRDIHHVLVSNQRNSVKPKIPYLSVSFILGERGLVTLRDENLHTAISKVIRPALTGKCLKHIIDNHMPKHAAKMCDGLKQVFDDPVARDAGSADLEETLTRWTTDVTSEALFSTTHYEGCDLGAEFLSMMRAGGTGNNFKFALAPAWLRKVAVKIPGKFKRVYDGAMAHVGKIRSAAVAMAKAAAKRGQTEEVKSFVDVMAQSPMMMEDEELLGDNCMTVYGAASETTATAALHFITHMALNPRCQEILYDELKEAVALGVAPQHDDVKDLPYLQACIKESMRLTPSVAGSTRELIADDTLPSGLKLQAGTCIMASPFLLHRHPRWGDDVDTFNPERWLDIEKMEKLPAGLYIPFLLGKRMCTGAPMAMAELSVGMGAMMRRFEIELAPGEKAELPSCKLVVTRRPQPMMKVVMREREQ